MAIQPEELWNTLRPLLEASATRISSSVPGIVHTVGKSSNATFPLRAYASFRRSAQGNGVAITVDFVLRRGVGELAADVAFEDGSVILDGPTITFPDGSSHHIIAGWLNELRSFLAEAERKLAALGPELQ